MVRADSARPESISYLKRQDPRKERPYIPLIESVKKWPGSVEDGIEFIKSHKEVVIHTRCREMQKEARLYSFKTDKRTGDILPQIEDANNHYWDAVRYALGGLIKGKQSPMGIRLRWPTDGRRDFPTRRLRRELRRMGDGRGCLRGESEVKGKGVKYLPQPNPTDKSQQTSSVTNSTRPVQFITT